MLCTYLVLGAACGDSPQQDATPNTATLDEVCTPDEVVYTEESTKVEELPTTTPPTQPVTELCSEESLSSESNSVEENIEENDSQVSEEYENEDVFEETEVDDCAEEDIALEDCVQNEPDYENVGSDYSESEVDLIARTVYLESGGCGEYCQWLTASTILNLADERGGVESVVSDYNTFNVAGAIRSCSPSDTSYSVARRVVSGDRDYNVKAFRASYYHSFGTPYTNIDNVYFSTY